ncbi:hypothetical protein ANO11243_010320 [Dothideomycetidae sp. 11243]|nr:hypothetical protein ANO11243_010320 [fungal sp. No.11243]
MRLLLLLPVLLARLTIAAAITSDDSSVDVAGSDGDIAAPATELDLMRMLQGELIGRDAESASSLEDEPEPSEVTALAIRPKYALGSLLGTFKNRMIYLASTKFAKVSVKDVVQELDQHKKTPSVRNERRGFILETLQWTLLIILTLAVIFKEPTATGMQIINVGLDDGKYAMVKRQSIVVDHPVDVVSWDLSDDKAHAAGNTHENRPIISDELRTQMLAEGHSNVTFLQHNSPDGKTPALLYRTADDVAHYHWRPTPRRPARVPRKDQVFSKHYAFFDADGAGFKISAQNPITDAPPMKEADAKPIAAAIASDFLNKRSSATYAGYQEQFKDSKMLGHKLCLIAESKRFNLNNELGLCFK